MPPGSERLDTLAELVPGLRGIVVVTIPSDASYRAVKRAVEAARAARIPILGVVENMAGYRCGSCRADGPLFAGDAGDRLARETGAPILARVPFDPALQARVDAGDAGAAAEALGARARVALGAPRARRPPREERRRVKFLCIECDRQMAFAERELPGDGTLAAVFACPACGRSVAMLTNPMETQLVSSLGVQIGGRSVPEQPFELTRSAVASGREDAFADAPPAPTQNGPCGTTPRASAWAGCRRSCAAWCSASTPTTRPSAASP